MTKKIVFNKIRATPPIEGEDAKRFIEDMNRPMTEHEKMIQERIKNRRDVEIIR